MTVSQHTSRIEKRLYLYRRQRQHQLGKQPVAAYFRDNLRERLLWATVRKTETSAVLWSFLSFQAVSSRGLFNTKMRERLAIQTLSSNGKPISTKRLKQKDGRLKKRNVVGITSIPKLTS